MKEGRGRSSGMREAKEEIERDLKRWREICTHHEGIDKEVVVLEGIECGRGVDSVLVALAQFQSCHNRGQTTKHRVEEQLHFHSANYFSVFLSQFLFLCELSERWTKPGRVIYMPLNAAFIRCSHSTLTKLVKPVLPLWYRHSPVIHLLSTCTKKKKKTKENSVTCNPFFF